jgi:hypothetical protein
MNPTRHSAGRTILYSFAALCAAAICNRASATPVVTYTVTGSAFDYQLDFTIDNLSSFSIFDVGLYPSSTNPGVIGAPAGFQTNGQNWQDVDFSTDQQSGHLSAGTVLSGFIAEDDIDPVAPTSFNLTLQLSDSLNDDADGLLRINEQVTATEAVPTVPDSGATIGLLALAMGAMGGVSLLSMRGRPNRSTVSLGS